MSLNTTPRTFVTAEVETAAIFNAELRDALTGIQAAWTAWTPTWTNLTVGNGVLTARSSRVGKTVALRLDLVGGTTSSASGAVSVSLPFSAHGTGNQTLHLRHWNAATLALGGAYINAGAPTVVSLTTTAVPTGISTFGNGHQVTLEGTYEAA